jgi:D-alanyl-D-alanine endopeptidase (penicillin-binding protein 7)
MSRGQITWSTLFLGSVAAVLAVGTGITLWYVWQTPAAEPPVLGAQVALGLPANDLVRDNRQFNAASALAWDTGAGEIIFEQNGFERRPIASLTKLMTAMVALDYGIDFDQTVSILPEEYVQGGRLLLHAGETVTMRDLFHASLLGSANNATLAYVRALNIPEREFLLAMNRKAVELELEQTFFVDVTGLDSDNVSTAYEISRLATAAFTHYPEIAEATSRAEYTFTVGGSQRSHTMRNTNKLVSEGGLKVRGTKTGYLYEAGYCLVTAVEGRTTVILGSLSEPGHFADTQRLLNLSVP